MPHVNRELLKRLASNLQTAKDPSVSWAFVQAVCIQSNYFSMVCIQIPEDGKVIGGLIQKMEVDSIRMIARTECYWLADITEGKPKFIGKKSLDINLEFYFPVVMREEDIIAQKGESAEYMIIYTGGLLLPIE
jgi:hypothetical protein